MPQGRELSALSRALAPRVAPGRFNLVGLHWRGSGTVEFRTRSARGPWSAWNDALPEREDRPDTGAAEGRPTTWTLGNPWWTGPARWIQYRLNGDVAALRAYFLWSPPRAPLRVPTSAERPLLISRSGWGADESIVREAPLLAPELHLAVVHHTAGANSYSREDSAAIVRGIEVYHVKANGWNDIGYNFLVDKYGQVFEGRAGGIDQNVVGAHAQGFNTGSVGVAVLGTYGAQSISPAARTALADLLAWRLDIAHVDPLSTLAVVSGGNERFSPGEVVTLRAISGHRDTGSTACPGGALYAALDELAAKVAARGLPKLYEPAAAPRQLEPLADGSVSPVVLTARLSGVLPWSITVANDETGAVVANASGTGSSISWTWDGTGPDGQPVDLTGRYVVTISAPGATPATMVLSPRAAPPGGSGESIDITDLGIAPAVITPNGDGKADRNTDLVRPLSGRPRLRTCRGRRRHGCRRADRGPRAPGRAFGGELGRLGRWRLDPSRWELYGRRDRRPTRRDGLSLRSRHRRSCARTAGGLTEQVLSKWRWEARISSRSISISPEARMSR